MQIIQYLHKAINEHRLQVRTTKVPHLNRTISRTLHVNKYLISKRNRSFYSWIPAQLISQIIVTLPIIAMRIHRKANLKHVVARRKQRNINMLLATVLNVIIEPQIQMIIPELSFRQHNNNSSSTFWKWEQLSTWTKVFDHSYIFLKIYHWVTA